jgi:di/tricarboxylate transporter
VLSPALLSGAVLVLALVFFAWGRVRHDVVALLALGACVLLGLTPTQEAFSGFADSSVVVVAAVLVIGRAIELTGVAAAATERLASLRAPFSAQLAVLLVAGAALSAFMNNIAALAITMPAVASVCRAAKLPPSAGLMPLAFATILGGVMTLIGTPANLVLSSVRQSYLGEPFGFFDMSAVGVAVAIAGLLYLCLVGWRLAPQRKSSEGDASGRRMVFEVQPASTESDGKPPAETFAALKEAGAHVLSVVRHHRRLSPDSVEDLRSTDRVLVISGDDPWSVAKKANAKLDVSKSPSQDAVTARLAVAHGSPLIGRPFDTIPAETDGQLRFVAAGSRVVKEQAPLGAIQIEAGDQIMLHGPSTALEPYLRYARLLEVDRQMAVKVSLPRASLAVGIYAIAVLGAVTTGVSTALLFAAAAVALACLNFLPPREVYSSIDWPVIVLLGAMIPVGQSFETSGAAQAVAQTLAMFLQTSPLIAAAAALTTVTLLLSVFLNNVATAVIMGPVAIGVARAIEVSPDALLIAVLIGASADFLTPIGHQNNLLVMGPGGYRFGDYARVGAALCVLVVATSAIVISLVYG